MQQLKNIQRIRVVKYRYHPQFAVHSGLASVNDCNDVVDTGVIAQEVRKVLPDAVKEAGSVVLPDGFVIDNFLVVNKDRLFMENIGAVQELCKMTGKLKRRIESIECRLNDLRIGGMYHYRVYSYSLVTELSFSPLRLFSEETEMKK